jgi:hypothetical protein
LDQLVVIDLKISGVKTTGKLAAPRNNVHNVLDAPVEARGDHLLVKQTLEDTMRCKTSAIGTS